MIIFIDGPNGSGKDFAIDKISEEYGRRYPKALVDVISIKTVMRDTTELLERFVQRKTYDFDDEVVEATFQKHLDLLYLAERKCQDNHLLFVNRFIPSFWVYQFALCEKDVECRMQQWENYYDIYLGVLRRLSSKAEIFELFLLPDAELIVSRLDKAGRHIDPNLIKGQLREYKHHITHHKTIPRSTRIIMGNDLNTDIIIRQLYKTGTAA